VNRISTEGVCVCVCGVACVTIVAAIRGLNRYSVEKDLLASDQASTRMTKVTCW
jgi:hypothetical protein